MSSSVQQRNSNADSTLGAPRGILPGEPGIWVFIFGDLAIFGALFVGFGEMRRRHAAEFAVDQAALSPVIGVINTVLLVTASWCIATAVARRRNGASVTIVGRATLGAIVCGAGFVVCKSIEWGLLVADERTVNSSTYFSLYFTYTGTHLIHVLIGIGLLIRLWLMSRDAPPAMQQQRTWETSALFWHMVDLLWIVLFALFYVVR